MKNKISIDTGKFWQRIFISEKLDNWIGYIIFLGIALLFGFLIAHNSVVGMGFTALLFGTAIVVVCLMNTEAGLYINILYSFFAYHFSRMLFNDEFPVGVVSDILVLSTFLSLFIKRIEWKKTINEFTRKPVVVWILILFFYLSIELFNPYAHSFAAWFQTFRKILGSLMVLFFSYNVFTSYKVVKNFIVYLFIICAITGIYGCIQQWHGLFGFEYAWATADEIRFGLLFINGEFRKFSTLSDASSFGVMMASCAVLFLVLAWNLKKPLYKGILLFGSIFMILGMAYSGTRTANAMFVAGLFMFVLLTINKRNTKIFAAIAAIGMLGLMFAPIYDNPTINRFRSTFSGTEDESYKVREMNRAFIQPYIYSHPIGGGLCTTGGLGLIYNPSHYLAGFPPDSGYLKKALETGWIGFTIICILYFTVLKFGIRGYFRAKDERIKTIYAAAISSIFSFYIAEFAQDALGQITDLVVYYPLIALILRIRATEESVFLKET